jgi:Ca2+-binding EF-hand superfamily protein
MDRVFAFLDQGNKGKLSHEDLERVGLMFSADSQELIAFRFFVYDASAKGFITKEDMTKMVRAIFETTLKVRERDLEALAKQDKAEEGALEKFRKARDQFLGKSDVVDSKISQVREERKRVLVGVVVVHKN